MAPYDPYIAYKDLTVDLRAHRCAAPAASFA